MNKELLQGARTLWETDKKIDKFGTRYNHYPYQETGRVLEGMNRLVEQIPDNPSPGSVDEFHEGELRRRLESKTLALDHFLYGKPYTLEDVTTYLGIEQDDIAHLRTWLLANRDTTIEAIERLFKKSDVKSFELTMPADIPSIRRQAEGYAEIYVANYHTTLGELFQELTQAGKYLDLIIAQPTNADRSYFNPLTRRLALRISDICIELENRTLQIREREILRLYGHEGMGHALQGVITNQATLPFFLKESDNGTIASEESITQFYERVIFDDVKNSPKTQRDLKIAQNYEELYQEEQDTMQIKDYNRNLFYYGITILADKAIGDPTHPETLSEKARRLSEVTLNPAFPRSFVEQHRYAFDSAGNLNYSLLSELRYCCQAVPRAVKTFEENGIVYTNRGHRSHIDMTFLTGYFTPTGFVQKANLSAQGKI